MKVTVLRITSSRSYVKAFLGVDPTASDMLLFHIDPPLESEDPSSTTTSYYVASTTILFAGTIAGIFLIKRHKRMQAETVHASELAHIK